MKGGVAHLAQGSCHPSLPKKMRKEMEYERPELEEIPLIIEGSFLLETTGVDKEPEEGGGDDWD